MKAMNRSQQVAFGNFVLRKYGINDQVTAELIEEFYSLTPDQKEEMETFVFPDDLDKIVPTGIESVPPSPAKKKTKSNVAVEKGN